jgi:hypothetical protein
VRSWKCALEAARRPLESRVARGRWVQARVTRGRRAQVRVTGGRTAGGEQGHPWTAGGRRSGSPLDGGRMTGLPMAGRSVWVRVAGGRPVDVRVTSGWTVQNRVTHGRPVGSRQGCLWPPDPVQARVPPPPPSLSFWTTTTAQPLYLQLPYCTDHLPGPPRPHPQNVGVPREAAVWGGGRRWVALRAIANPIQNRSRRRHNSRHEPLYGGCQHTQVRRVYGEGRSACQSV